MLPSFPLGSQDHASCLALVTAFSKIRLTCTISHAYMTTVSSSFFIINTADAAFRGRGSERPSFLRENKSHPHFTRHHTGTTPTILRAPVRTRKHERCLEFGTQIKSNNQIVLHIPTLWRNKRPSFPTIKQTVGSQENSLLEPKCRDPIFIWNGHTRDMPTSNFSHVDNRQKRSGIMERRGTLDGR